MSGPFLRGPLLSVVLVKGCFAKGDLSLRHEKWKKSTDRKV